jgi:hypothetical protein
VRAGAKLAAFAAILAALFAGGALLGGVTEPDARGGTPAPAPAGGPAANDVEDDHGHAAAPEEDDEMETADTNTPAAAGAGTDTGVHGLAVAEAGLRVEVDRPELRRGRAERIAFRIVRANGEAVRDVDVTHEKRMHLIVVRRDLTGFQHLHPELGSDGTWTTRATLAAAGSYRLFADFSHDGEATTLATDLRVDGPADLRPLPAPAPTAQSDGGYDVRLDSAGIRAGTGSDLRFSITRDGATVHTEPYLGAGGHLVALREGDLAFLHVHPTGHGDEQGHDDAVGFEATFPTAGRYRLFLQFQHEGKVQTVAFTQDVAR